MFIAALSILTTKWKYLNIPQLMKGQTKCGKSIQWGIAVFRRFNHVCLCSPRTVAHQVPLSMEFSRQVYWSGLPCPPPRDFPNPGIESRSPALQADSLPAEPQGRPENTGVDSLSHLQRIFPTQESNWVLLHCRRILYQLSYQGNPPHCYALPISL